MKRFQDVIDKMALYVKKLETCEVIRMNTKADRRTLRHTLPASKGVYVLYECGKPMYVGRSDKLADRLLQHGQPSGGSETASFAFNIAKDKFAGSQSVSRQELQQNAKFKDLFTEAKDRVRKMDVRVVGIEDDIEQAIFEIYAHMKLATRYNTFENH